MMNVHDQRSSRHAIAFLRSAHRKRPARPCRRMPRRDSRKAPRVCDHRSARTKSLGKSPSEIAVRLGNRNRPSRDAQWRALQTPNDTGGETHQAGRRPRCNPDRTGRRRCRRRDRISGLDLHARRRCHPGTDNRAGAGGRGHRRENGRQPGVGEESARNFPPAARGADRPVRSGDAPCAPIPRRPVRVAEVRHYRRSGTVPAV